MDDAPFAAAHRVEVEGPVGAFDAFGRRDGAQAQLLNPERPVIVGVETQQGMVLGRHAQSFHGQKFERQQNFGLIRQQKIHFGAFEFHQQIGIFQIRMQVLAFQDFERQIQVHIIEDHFEKIRYALAGRGDSIFLFVHLYYLPFFLTGAGRGGGGGAGIIRFTAHCCAIPTKLLVSQYNTSPAEKL